MVTARRGIIILAWEIKPLVCPRIKVCSKGLDSILNMDCTRQGYQFSLFPLILEIYTYT
ncbi:hypothetical protein HMPREF9441_02151 [Paraprevotella clara YIT 11840]|uniref:Uncharacterized protein n=1 Tax=Paraprevotella clara YIT 11840 TaxID=762968 RepID=G5SS02_9BACT|nr:hypothetical protein HMPREF9441_02151 [Paraprevotella clara YIT 11840]